MRAISTPKDANEVDKLSKNFTYFLYKFSLIQTFLSLEGTFYKYVESKLKFDSKIPLAISHTPWELITKLRDLSLINTDEVMLLNKYKGLRNFYAHGYVFDAKINDLKNTNEYEECLNCIIRLNE